jgi:hypothetical protein
VCAAQLPGVEEDEKDECIISTSIAPLFLQLNALCSGIIDPELVPDACERLARVASNRSAGTSSSYVVLNPQPVVNQLESQPLDQLARSLVTLRSGGLVLVVYISVFGHRCEL